MKLTHREEARSYGTLAVLIIVACIPSLAQMTSVGIECSEVWAHGVDKQVNMRAGRAMIECGFVPGGAPAATAEQPVSEEALDPLVQLAFTNILVSNRSCSSSSSCTKSESMVWAGSGTGRLTIVDNYNDHNPTYGSYSGTSYSTDEGATFTEIQPPPFATGHGTNFGDPIVVFNVKRNEFFAGDLVTGCGNQGIGLWTSGSGTSWFTGACAHNGSSDDRESMWVDNEPTSGMYGRMYISFNDFSNNNGALSLIHSDDGVSWSAPVILNSNFIRNVQLTGSPVGGARYEGTNSTVFVATMDEGGGGLNTRQNVIYKSLDGGVTWTSTTTGPRFAPPGSVSCGYFEAVAPIWRHMGWGQPGVGPSGVVHYAYAGAGTNGDTGDIYYVRSTDNGRTWSTPIKLNTDTDNSFHTQWMPSLSADQCGEVTVSWYDRRAATSSCTVATDPGCSYERVGIQSGNNGSTFGSEITISSATIPQPTQTDPNVQACYAGDYNYDTTLNGDFFDTWTDGRRAVSGVQVQDVNFAGIPAPNSPTVASQTDNPPHNAWSNVNGIINGSNASVTFPSPNPSPFTSNRLNATGYGFSVPSNASIVGIRVSINRNSDANGINEGVVHDNLVTLLKAGVPTGNNKAASSTAWPILLGVASYGSSCDLWGASWTPADINDPAFGVGLKAAENFNGGGTGNVNYVRVTVTYQVP